MKNNKIIEVKDPDFNNERANTFVIKKDCLIKDVNPDKYSEHVIFINTTKD